MITILLQTKYEGVFSGFFYDERNILQEIQITNLHATLNMLQNDLYMNYI